jgi:uncharacterized protein YkwD
MPIATRPVRGAWTVRPRACRPARSRRAFAPGVDALEDRRLLSATGDAFAPTADEQYMLAIINRARANPAAEGQRLLAMVKADPLLQTATASENLNTFIQEIDSFGPEPPLAFNTELIEAALDHSNAMLQANSQFHSPPGYLNDTSVAVDVAGQAFYPTGNGGWATGENIYAYSNGVNGNDAAYVDFMEAAFELDWGNPDFGHLTNLLAPGPGEFSSASGGHYPYSEIGIGFLTNVSPPGASATGSGINVGPDIVTQEFGWRSGNPILTGVLFTDTGGTGFYAPGEGLGGVTIRAVGQQGQGVFTATTWASGGYSLPLPPGSYSVTATGAIPYALSTTVTLAQDNVEWDHAFTAVAADQPVPGDYRGVGFAELAVYRPSTGQWFFDGQAQPLTFGLPNVDLPVPGDYNGVGHTEAALYRPTTAQWVAYTPTGGVRLVATFGWAGVDIPVPDDYGGVGYTEPAVYRPITAQWFVDSPTGGKLLGTFGWAGVDIPEPGDYDGVGHDEAAVYRPTTGQWFVLGPHGGELLATLGQPGDIPVPGDYDGVGHIEPAVYRPSTGQWFILGPNGVRSFQFGEANVDVPIRADFNGDGKTDPAVYRPPTAEWYVKLSTTNNVVYRQFGQGGISTPITSWLGLFASHPSPRVTQTIVSVPLAPWGSPAALAVGSLGVIAQERVHST